MSAAKNRPDFVVIGAQKAGTSFVARCLAGHPRIFMPETEIPFFRNENAPVKDAEDFNALFAGLDGGTIAGVKDPLYLATAGCAEKIAENNPGTKIIAVLRDPLDRMLSAYYMNMCCNQLPVVEPETGIARILEKRGRDKSGPERRLTECGFYHRHLSRYYRNFDRAQVMVLLYDDLKASPLAEIRKIYGFLGAEKNFKPGCIGRRENAGTYSLTAIRLFALAQAALFVRNTSFGLADGGVYLHCRPKNRFCGAIAGAGKGIYRELLPCIGKKPRLSRGLSEKIRKMYAPDIRRLEKILGRNLSGWKANGGENNG
ncbi:MAG: sulfotransferase domain-containing protein [Candidatus Diapherotrites archaeon]|nr:sulfotransferase domain-containing protein [Candidatus Diapherotrites archaeon]